MYPCSVHSASKPRRHRTEKGAVMGLKHVILRADSDGVVYLVPDVVAEQLGKYCLDFASHWLHHSPYAEKYKIKGGVCYCEADFIDDLNQDVFPQEPSVMVERLGEGEIPEKYRGCPFFAF